MKLVKFISGTSEIYINIEHVISIEQSFESGVLIRTTCGHFQHVNGTLDEVLAAIEREKGNADAS